MKHLKTYRVPKHRPVHLTMAEWLAELRQHVPPSTRWLSREQVVEIRHLHRPLRPGALSAWDTRLSERELARLMSLQTNRKITRGAINFLVRMPEELLTDWLTVTEHQRLYGARWA